MVPTDEHIHERWTARTLWVAGAILLMTAAFVLTKTGRDALYFMGKGLYDLPKAYLGIAFLSLPMAALVLGMMRAFGPRRARILGALVMSGALTAYSRAAHPGGGPLMTFFFMLVPLAFGVLFSLSWLLAADLLDRAPRPRLAASYGIVGAASILGGVLGGLTAKALAPHVEPQAFILWGGVLLAASAAVTAVAHGLFPTRMLAPAAGGLRQFPADFPPLLRQRYVRLLMAVGMAAAVVGLLVEFQFYLAAAASGRAGRENADFFANAYLALNASALVVQLLLMPRLQRAVGVHGSLLVMPGLLLGGIAAVLASASLFLLALVRVAEGGLKSSIHRVNWEQAYLPLDRPQRRVAKLLVDGAGARIGEGMAAAMLYLWLTFVIGDRGLKGQDTTPVALVLLGALALWLLLTRALGRTLAAVTASVKPDEEFRPDIPLPDT